MGGESDVPSGRENLNKTLCMLTLNVSSSLIRANDLLTIIPCFICIKKSSTIRTWCLIKCYCYCAVGNRCSRHCSLYSAFYWQYNYHVEETYINTRRESINLLCLFFLYNGENKQEKGNLIYLVNNSFVCRLRKILVLLWKNTVSMVYR